MAHLHHPIFVVLSLLVAVFGSWTALDLFRRVRSHIGRTRLVWLGTAAVAMGVSIWSMHFIAMLGFAPGAPVSYDPGLTLLSLALAIGATWGAFFTAASERARQGRVFLAGAAMGAGICLMHYVGMAAMRTAIALAYDPVLVIASFVVAVVAATAALFAARRERATKWRAGAALILGFAIVGMHYTAMAALRLTPGAAHLEHAGAPPLVLGVGVAAGTLLILFLGLLASLYDQRLNVLSALDAGGVGYWELSLPGMAYHLSSKGKELLGRARDEPFGLPELMSLLPREEQDKRAQLLDRAIATGQEYATEYRFVLESGEEKWVSVRGRVVSWSAGRPRRLAGVMFDVTERQQAFAAVAESEQRQRLLIDELNHRVKNTLATVQSIARQSAKAPTPEAFRELFDARLVALSQTHNALTRSAWKTAGLQELLQQELGPYPKEQVRLKGPDVDLSPREALALGMIFHELATNAAKYGALSVATGCVEVAWSLAAGAGPQKLDVNWTETGGPPVAAPSHRGFGSRLIMGSVTGELAGQAELGFEPEGLRCRLCVPLARVCDGQAA